MTTDQERMAEARLRLTAQLKLLTKQHPRRLASYSGDGVIETDDLAHFRFLYDPTGFLVRVDSRRDVNDALSALFVVDDPPEPDSDPELADYDLVRFPLPKSRHDGAPPRVLDALDLIDDALGIPDHLEQDKPADMAKLVASPDHWLHVCGVGSGRICPAVEPEVTTATVPYPRFKREEEELGAGVRVSVVDSGWHPPAAIDEDTPWMLGVDGDLENTNGQVVRKYAGHGTFVAGVVRCFAPGADVRVEGFLGKSGAIRESKMIKQLGQAVTLHDPRIINLSAGTVTRKNRPLLSFERFYEKRLAPLEGTCLLVAAAGNEGVIDPFWPASYEWALGVGSLDRDGTVSDFSNFGDSAKVYAVGRDIVNAFPTGRYTTREPPHPDQRRDFTSGLARWSGTSFSAPMVSGLIAAELAAQKDDQVLVARDTVLATAQPAQGPVPVAGGAPITVQALPVPPD